MPLIQKSIAQLLNARVSNISLGLYSFSDKAVGVRQFSEREVQIAMTQFESLFRDMGFYS